MMNVGTGIEANAIDEVLASAESNIRFGRILKTHDLERVESRLGSLAGEKRIEVVVVVIQRNLGALRIDELHQQIHIGLQSVSKGLGDEPLPLFKRNLIGVGIPASVQASIEDGWQFLDLIAVLGAVVGFGFEEFRKRRNQEKTRSGGAKRIVESQKFGAWSRVGIDPHLCFSLIGQEFDR